jgi:hypothetical protein
MIDFVEKLKNQKNTAESLANAALNLAESFRENIE